jgi:hypothetical protein
MAKTTFSGPLRAGPIFATTGTTLGRDVKNTGCVVMSQHYHVEQALTATALPTNIVLPANSHIIHIQLAVTEAWTGAATTLTIGTSAAADELVAATDIGTVGYAEMIPGTDPARVALWDDTGTTDKRVFVKSANVGSGHATLIIMYLQAHDDL